MTRAQKIALVRASGLLDSCDWLRCRACDIQRIADGRTDDICVPCNLEDVDLRCACGDVREPYDCQGQRFDGAPLW